MMIEVSPNVLGPLFILLPAAALFLLESWKQSRRREALAEALEPRGFRPARPEEVERLTGCLGLFEVGKSTHPLVASSGGGETLVVDHSRGERWRKGHRHDYTVFVRRDGSGERPDFLLYRGDPYLARVTDHGAKPPSDDAGIGSGWVLLTDTNAEIRSFFDPERVARINATLVDGYVESRQGHLAVFFVLDAHRLACNFLSPEDLAKHLDQAEELFDILRA